MAKYGFKGNGETFFADQQSVGADVLLRTAFDGKANGEDPDRIGDVLRVSESDVAFRSWPTG